MKHRRTTSAFLAIAGLACIALGQFGVRTSGFHPPVPIDNFGLPVEAVDPTQEFVASLPGIQVVGADSDAENQRKRVVLDSLLLKANGGEWPWHGPQETGDCAGQSFGLAIEVDEASQIDDGADIVFRPVNRQWLYSGGRCNNGKIIIRGAGAIPSLIGEHVEANGVLWADAPNAPPYSGSSADQWGKQCPPAAFAEEAAQYKVTNVAACRSAQDVCNAINAGYPVPFGSMKFGTDSIKLIEGRNVARDTTNWPHAQCVTGYDGTLKSGQRLFRIVNSWGRVDSWLRDQNVMSLMPGDHPGGYYVTWEVMDAICREGMTFALSGTQGFRQREFVPDFSVIGAAGPAAPQAVQETEAMFPFSPNVAMLFTIIGSVLLALAAVAWTLRGNRRGRTVAGAAALMLALTVPRVIPAQEFRPDFASLTVAATNSATISTSGLKTANESTASAAEFAPDFALLAMKANAPHDAGGIRASVQTEPPAVDFATLSRAACDACACKDCLCAECDGKTCSAVVNLLAQAPRVSIADQLRARTVDEPPPKPKADASIPVTIRGQWLHWSANGVNYHNEGTGVFNGATYGKRWLYRDGRMIDQNPQPVTKQPAVKAGRWAYQCNGGVCSLVWVP